MIRLACTSDALAATRFAIAPTHQAVHLLHTATRWPLTLPDSWRQVVRQAAGNPRLATLFALVNPSPAGNHYLPDFLTPEPVGHQPTIDAELHQVATTSSDRVRDEFAIALHGKQAANIEAYPLPRTVLRLLDRGESTVAEVLARQLDDFARMVLAPRWPRLRARLQADVRYRSEVGAAHGMASTLNGLDPGLLTWRAGALEHAGPLTADIAPVGMTLVPSLFEPRSVVAINPCDRSSAPLVIYPARSRAPADQPPGEQDMAPVLGATRAELLADLAVPRSTAELAARLHLSPSTVSYHLQLLYRAGLLRRTRSAHRVLYQHIPDDPPHWTAEPPPG